MKQEDIDVMMRQIDKKCKLPKYWNDFIDKQTKNFHYIIKDVNQKECYCTNCKNTFYDTKTRISKYFKCPNCKNEFCVVSKNSNYIRSFKKSVNLVQRINKNIITRVFEIETFYNSDTKMMENDIEEYCRIIPGKGKFLSNAVWFSLGYMQIYHCIETNISWRKYDGCRYFSDYTTYPFSQAKMIKGTKFQYAPIKEFIEKFRKYNFIDAIQFAAYNSFELLWNMKLYSLCLDAEKFNRNGSFYKRFGVSKKFFKFMQNNDIDYRELKLLKLFQTEDYNLIEQCYRFNIKDVKFLYDNKILKTFLDINNYISSGNIESLKEISEFIPLRKLNNYLQGIKNLHIYRDYLVMSKKLSLNYKSKDDLFPENLIERHNELQEKLTITEDINTQTAFYLRYLELSKYTYSDEKFIIFPATSVSDLKDEGRQQGNCVGYLYLDKYIKKETEIYFIRKLDNITKSFITLEFRNGFVAQKELPNHSRNFNQEQLDFIDAWCNFRKLIDKKEKYQQRDKTQTTKYDLTKLVA